MTHYTKKIEEVVNALKVTNTDIEASYDVPADHADIEDWGWECPDEIALKGFMAINDYIKGRAYEEGAFLITF